MKHHHIAVIGGTGKAGTYLVSALMEKGYTLNLLIRNPEKAGLYQHPDINIIIGTAGDPRAIEALLQGCSAVISTLGLGIPASEPDIFSSVTWNIITAMQQRQSSRYVVITGLNVDAPTDRKGPRTAASTAWMKEHFPISTADKQLEYELLSRSNVDWTMVRLPKIEQTEVLREINVRLEDCPGEGISAASLAQFLIAQLDDKTYIQQAPFISNK